MSILKKFWSNGYPQKIIGLFDEQVEYYQSSEIKLTFPGEIKIEWEENVKKMKNKVTYKLLTIDDNCFTVEFKLDEDIEKTYIFEIKLNEKGTCQYFKKW